jgi:type IVB pilus formation R64 PilN family outer membrane protein
MKNLFVKSAVAAVLATSLGACEVYESNKDVRLDRTEKAESITQELERRKETTLENRYGNSRVVDGVWLGAQGYVSPHGDPLPTNLEASDGFVLNSGGLPITLREITAEITAQTGIVVQIDDALRSVVGGANGVVSSSGGTGGASSSAPVTPSSAVSGGESSDEDDEDSALAGTMPVDWVGPISGFIDSLASYYDLEWEYKEGKIRLYRYVTKVYRLQATPGENEYTVSQNGQLASSASSSEGAANASSTTSMGLASEVKSNLWDEVITSLQGIIPDNQGSMVASPATGLVTVVASPIVQEKVNEFLHRVNELITRQVVLNVKIIKVEKRKRNGAGADLKALVNMAGRNYMFQGPGINGNGFLGANGGNVIQMVMNNPTSPYNESYGFIQALKLVADTVAVREFSLTTMNGQAVPLSSINGRRYIKEIEVTVSNDTPTTQYTTDDFKQGISLQVLPVIMDDNAVSMQVAFTDISGTIETLIDSGTNLIQSPNYTGQNIVENITVPSTMTYVFGGLISSVDETNSRGTPDVGMLLGGEVSSDQKEEMLLYMIQPIVVNLKVEQQ